MKPELMERVRRLNPVPEPSAPAPDHLLEQIVALRRESSRPSRGRRLAAIMALPAAAAIAIMVVIGVRSTGAPEDPLTALPPTRVDWGMDVRVTLHPDPDVSLDEMRTRVKTAIAQRSEQLDAAGVSVQDVNGDTMTVRIPGTQSPSEVRSFLDFPRIRVLDIERSVIRYARTLDDLKPAVAAAGPAPKGGTVVYVQPEGQPGQPLSAPMRFPKSSAPAMIASLRRSEPRRKIFTLETPADTYVVTDSRTNVSEFFLIRPVDLVATSAVERSVIPVSTSPPMIDRSRINLRISDEAALPDTASGVWIAQIGPGTGPEDETRILKQVQFSQSMRASTIEGDSVDHSFAQRFGQSDIGGSVTFDEPTRWGAPPMPGGKVLSVAPRWAERPFVRKGATWMNVIQTRTGGSGPYELIIGVLDRRIVAAGMSTPGGHGSYTSSSSDRGICEEGIGAPRVRPCDTSTRSLSQVDGRLVRMDTVYGRVQPGVRLVAVRAENGTMVTATIENGWFMAVADTIGPHPKGQGANLFKTPVEIQAWDESGNPVPVAQPFYG